MNILQLIKKLRDDLKAWAILNFTHLNKKIDDNRAYADSRRFSGDYNDLKNAPSIITGSDEDFNITDNAGNIIFKADNQGIHTTALSLHGQDVEDIIEDRVAALVDGAPDMLQTLDSLAQALGEDPNFATTMTNELGNKVDKVAGKGLSTNDFTDEYKNKIDNPDLLEQDPTVPAWAKNPVKPSYTKAEVGLSNVDNTSDLDKPVSNAVSVELTRVNTNITDLQETLSSEVVAMQEHVAQFEQTIKTEIGEAITSADDSFSIADDAGNIIALVDNNGVHSTNFTANGSKVATEDYVDNSLTDYNEEVITLVEESVAAVSQTVTTLKEDLQEGIESNTDTYSIVDGSGNIIATFDANGLETTTLTVQSLVINGKEMNVAAGSGLPEVTTAHNGKVLQVVNGEWQLVTPVAVLG